MSDCEVCDQPIYTKIKRTWRERLTWFPFRLWPAYRKVRDFNAEEQREKDREADRKQVEVLGRNPYYGYPNHPLIDRIAAEQRQRQEDEAKRVDAHLEMLRDLNNRRSLASLAEAGFVMGDDDKDIIKSGGGGDFGGAGADGSWDKREAQNQGLSHHDSYEQRLLQHGELAGSIPSRNLCGNASGLTGAVGSLSGSASASFAPTQPDTSSPQDDADTDSNDTQPVLHLIQPEMGSAVGSSDPQDGFYHPSDPPNPTTTDGSQDSGSRSSDSGCSTDDKTDWSAA